ncbi:response regulator [Candidatus Comchoanobacter bicostacola]|uniref:Response regulator n=1 Tax=Candidatus Comchoanobacter bicostacola TaxID=2919598 RepID=A0ABY5DN66_9GAMM|nr:response regulator [Candidatus Comchoanobacter bicostacola]UTC24970.1 response regulator [Candidatus Comchoanobacter bicostacola]
MTSDLIKVVIIDDEELVRAGIAAILSTVSGIEVVGQGSSGEDAIKICRQLTPDVVLLDINMPGIGGYGAVRTMAKMHSESKILVLTAHSNDVMPVRLLQAGAKGYITKSSTKADMVRAIKMIHLGQHYISPEIASKIALNQIDRGGKQLFDTLSEREMQVCIKIVSGVRPQDIANEFHLSAKTINSYRYRIFEKLQISSDVELTHLAIKHKVINFDTEEL